MQIDEIDREIRRAVQAEALAYEAPMDLAEETMARARSLGKPSIWVRLQGRLKGVETRPYRRTHKWTWTVTAAALMAAFFAVGSVSLRNPTQGDSTGSGKGIGKGSEQGPTARSAQSCESGNCGGSLPAANVPVNKGNGSSVGAGDGGSGGSGGGLPFTQPASPQSATQAQSQPQAQSQVAGNSGPGSPAGPAIVRSGTMELRVSKRSFAARWTAANEIAVKYGGLVAGSTAEQVKGRLSRGTITVRVPADKLDAAIADFDRLGTVARLNTSATDASAQISDYEARLRAAQAQEVQLLEILSDAKTVSDSLQVRAPLADVRREIETLQAERTRIANQVQLATMTVTLFEPQAKPEAPKTADGPLGQAWTKSRSAAATTLGGSLIALGYALPLVVVLLAARFGMRFRRRVV